MSSAPATTPESAERLAQCVQRRRAELRMSFRDVEQAGGPSHATLVRVERGQPCRYYATSLARLETALRWPPGAVLAVLSEPAASPAWDLPRAARAALPAGEAAALTRVITAAGPGLQLIARLALHLREDIPGD